MILKVLLLTILSILFGCLNDSDSNSEIAITWSFAEGTCVSNNVEKNNYMYSQSSFV